VARVKIIITRQYHYDILMSSTEIAYMEEKGGSRFGREDRPEMAGDKTTLTFSRCFDILATSIFASRRQAVFINSCNELRSVSRFDLKRDFRVWKTGDKLDYIESPRTSLGRANTGAPVKKESSD